MKAIDKVKIAVIYSTQRGTPLFKAHFPPRASAKERTMTLYEELYFEITLTGEKSELKRFISFLRSGELDEFFEFDPSYLDYRDSFDTISDTDITNVIFANDDWGIEIDEFDTDEFLDVFCRAGKSLDIHGRLFDVDEEEYEFISHKGDGYYLNAKKYTKFNDEIDEQISKEEADEEN